MDKEEDNKMFKQYIKETGGGMSYGDYLSWLSHKGLPAPNWMGKKKPKQNRK